MTTLTDEAKAAMRLKGPTNRRLFQILNSNEEKHEADSKLQRWMAAQVLISRGQIIVGTANKK
jgi:hypothetical protein